MSVLQIKIKEIDQNSSSVHINNMGSVVCAQKLMQEKIDQTLIKYAHLESTY